MTGSIRAQPPDRGPALSSARRRGAMPPSRRAISDLLEWIDEAQTAQRTWARNALLVVGTIAVLLWLALRLGLR